MGALFADYQPDLAGTAVTVDVEPLRRAHLDACVALAVQRDGGKKAAWRKALGRSLDADDRATFVALVDGRVAGYGTAGWFAPRDRDPDSAMPEGWYLLGLVVHARCRRRGVGRQLTVARLRWLQQRTDRAWYFASSANRPSIDLHAELGFQLMATNIEVPGVSFTVSGLLYGVNFA
ncbi:MAG: GNAT family N-acetyltransferase [Micropruina sp.]